MLSSSAWGRFESGFLGSARFARSFEVVRGRAAFATVAVFEFVFAAFETGEGLDWGFGESVVDFALSLVEVFADSPRTRIASNSAYVP